MTFLRHSDLGEYLVVPLSEFELCYESAEEDVRTLIRGAWSSANLGEFPQTPGLQVRPKKDKKKDKKKN